MILTVPVFASYENLGRVNEAHREPCVVDRLDGVGDLDHIRPYRPLRDAIRLCLQPTVLELRRLRLDMRLVECLRVRMVVVNDDERCRDRSRGCT